ncbi:MAG: Gfo/Idh/MocA family oxidoreductase [Eubacteriales bacterium]|nr:Gfo/Idh/MocA family oxidoreductase [Eubacteriales bacterium]
MKNVRFAVIGLGARGFGLMGKAVMPVEGVEIVGLCDILPDRVERARAVAEEAGYTPVCGDDYRQVLTDSHADAALIATGWECHVDMAVWCMEHGIVPAVEVGGAYCEADCWRLVDTYERTGTRIMLMENCCFNKSELLATAMARAGLFGRIVHCSGAYAHDLRSEILGSEERHHYRLGFYLNHNCENYPTHELGPIARLLGINRGNRMVSLVSVASAACGFADYVDRHRDTINPHRIGEEIKQGDIVTTLITCEGGETITLRLDASLPRFYNREFTVRGTRGMYEMGNNMVYFDGMEEWFDTLRNYTTYQNNAREYEEKYLPQEWRRMTEQGLKSGHGGMDGVEFRAFFEALRSGGEMPIDVYDMASWMSITYLSERSIANGGAPQAIPDFTRGKYATRPLRDVL